MYNIYAGYKIDHLVPKNVKTMITVNYKQTDSVLYNIS